MPIVQGENKSGMDIQHRNDRHQNQDSSNREPEHSNQDPKSNSELGKSKPMKRHQINQEKKQMTALFVDLITMVNTHVLKATGSSTICQQPVPRKSRGVAPQPQLKKKNTKTIKNLKQIGNPLKQIEKEKSCADSQQTPLPNMKTINPQIPRKLSSMNAGANNHAESAEVLQKKKQLFQNYSQLMSYKIHDFVQSTRNVEESAPGNPQDKNLQKKNHNQVQKDLCLKKSKEQNQQKSIGNINKNKTQNSEEKRKLSIARSVEMVVVKPIMRPHTESGCGSDQIKLDQGKIKMINEENQNFKDKNKQKQFKQHQMDIQEPVRERENEEIGKANQMDEMMDQNMQREEDESLPRYQLKNDINIDQIFPASPINGEQIGIQNNLQPNQIGVRQENEQQNMEIQQNDEKMEQQKKQ